MLYCNDCRLRSRDFPSSIVFDNGEKLTGKICKICDRKFLMLDQYKKRVMPMAKRDEDLRHLVQSYEIKLHKAQFDIQEEARLAEDLHQKSDAFKLSKRKLTASSKLHIESIKSGQSLKKEIDREIKMNTISHQKDRVVRDDADVELQYLEDELKNHKLREQKRFEEEKKKIA